jgi:hypothetical protein
MANYWYYNKDGKLYSSNEAKLWLAKDNCMHFGDLPQHVKDLNGLLPLTVKREWVGLMAEDYNEIFKQARSGEHAVQLAAAKLKDKNT